MKQALIIEVSPRGSKSASRQVLGKLSERLEAHFPGARLIHRDLASDMVPHLDYSTLKAISSNGAHEVEPGTQSVRLSDRLTDELLASDLLIIATPMWNFGIPSLLKAWIDLVVRPGRTFNYSGQEVIGLARNKRAILVLASGGVFTEGPWKPWDFVEPYLRTVLHFIGIDDVQTVRIEGTNMTSLAKSAVPSAVTAVENLLL